MFRRVVVRGTAAVLWSGCRAMPTVASSSFSFPGNTANQLLLFNSLPKRSFSVSSSKDGIIRNEDIKGEKMRVVHKDPVTNKATHEIMSRSDALKLAKKLDLDLILIDATSDPPVCKLDKYGQVLSDQKKKEKAQRANQKAHVLKEMMINMGIDKHDFDTKMNKVKSFLQEGNQVKVSLFSKKKPFYKSQVEKLMRNTVATSMSDLDEVTLFVFTALQDMPVMVQQNDFHNNVPCPPHVEGSFMTPTGTTMVRVHNRREFLIMPKGQTKPGAAGATAGAASGAKKDKGGKP